MAAECAGGVGGGSGTVVVVVDGGGGASDWRWMEHVPSFLSCGRKASCSERQDW